MKTFFHLQNSGIEFFGDPLREGQEIGDHPVRCNCIEGELHQTVKSEKQVTTGNTGGTGEKDQR